ncbi:hypothetical protein C7974DRAFT_452388 [Boeremia exigua]|uniref:uncharacterized protein n=1 Tax=Boeremia exigua TaxID=749465 RepID=UPI001E8D8B13|nr:uncharacterized protein C7974DRAFT_452388 [Boeremia exigua]KAH6633177.1 hypothetical protein C7974DRAFT_452388 [Boeremia exigua]
MHSMATTSVRTWGPDITEPDSPVASPTNLTPELSFLADDSWIDANLESVCAGESRVCCKKPLSAPEPDPVPYNDPQPVFLESAYGLNDTTVVTDSHTLDTLTFPIHAIHLLPSRPNGRWHAQVRYILRHAGESASISRASLDRLTRELDMPHLVHRLERAAEDRKDEFNRWLNMAFANYDLVAMHNRVQGLIPTVTVPNMRQLEYAIETAADIAQSLRKQHSQPELVKNYLDDRNLFAHTIGRKAKRALIEQGICRKWQLEGELNGNILDAMHFSLIHIFTQIQQFRRYVPLSQAVPRWVANREKKVWCLELDVGRIGIEIGSPSDRSFVELGNLKTGFEIPESIGCLSVLDFDRRTETVEDEWQLLEM